MLFSVGPPTIMGRLTERYPEPANLLEVEREVLRREGSVFGGSGLESDIEMISLARFGQEIETMETMKTLAKDSEAFH